EFRANQEFAEAPGENRLRPRAPWKLIAFWLFAANVVFLCYGATLGGFCSVSPGGARVALGIAGLALGAAVLWFILGKAIPWIEKRLPDYAFDADPDRARRTAGEGTKRKVITVVALVLCAGLF